MIASSAMKAAANPILGMIFGGDVSALGAAVDALDMCSSLLSVLRGDGDNIERLGLLLIVLYQVLAEVK